VLVAKQAIGVGQRLSDATIGWQDWPEKSVLSQYVTQAASPDAMKDMAGSIARFEIFPGEPIRQEKLVRADQGYLSAVLDSGMRGVSVAVDPEAASGGFVVPNDRVDVVLTRPSPTTGIQESTTVLRNVKVLAIDARLGETGATGAPTDPANPADPKAQVFAARALATLELDSAGAEVVINAANAGKLSLVLRSITDATQATSTSETAANEAIRMTSPFWTK
jgi:pilus assembly protein CpaB